MSNENILLQCGEQCERFFPERRVEGRFLGAVSLSSMTSLA